ncbi:MAG: rubrerythrin family protein [Desulfobacterales bacterium]|nr:MAG: rubrerythrin family protein [Desulfobacterales bacterium]
MPVQILFQWQIAKVHLKLLKEVLEESVHDLTTYYVCQICGYIAVEEAPLNCPVCNAIREKFRIEE